MGALLSPYIRGIFPTTMHHVLTHVVEGNFGISMIKPCRRMFGQRRERERGGGARRRPNPFKMWTDTSLLFLPLLSARLCVAGKEGKEGAASAAPGNPESPAAATTRTAAAAQKAPGAIAAFVRRRPESALEVSPSQRFLNLIEMLPKSR